jgi:hypothetical protein
MRAATDYPARDAAVDVTIRFIRALEEDHAEGGHDAGSMQCCPPCILHRARQAAR